MNRESIFIEVEELRSRLDDSNLRLYDATIIFFEIATDPTTAYEKYLQGHIPGAAFFDHDFFSDLDNKYEYMALSVAQLPERIGRVGISQRLRGYPLRFRCAPSRNSRLVASPVRRSQ